MLKSSIKGLLLKLYIFIKTIKQIFYIIEIDYDIIN